MKLNTVGDLRKIISDLDDDFKLDMRIMERIPEEELKSMYYPYPWRIYDAYLEFQDIGYSDKELCLGAYYK